MLTRLLPNLSVRKIEEHELVSKLKELANELGKTPTLNQFKEHFSRSTIAKHGYNNLVIKAGLRPNSTHPHSDELIIQKWKARILFLDIETSAILARVWGTFDQNIGLNQIVEDWSLISWAAQFNDSEEIHYQDQRNASHHTDDKKILESIHSLISECDIIVAHNIDFDWGKLNAKFIHYGLTPVHPRQFCTLKMARRLMKKGITSKKLEFLAKWLGCTPKEQHKKFHGMDLWNECLKGNIEAWNEMEIYNKGDIITLQEIFWKLARYDEKINFSMYQHANECICGSRTFSRDGVRVTNAGKKQRYKCSECGKSYLARVEELPAKIRQAIFS